MLHYKSKGRFVELESPRRSLRQKSKGEMDQQYLSNTRPTIEKEEEQN